MKPTIAITMGDFNGIGPEVILKSLLSPHISKVCRPILIGSIDVFEYYINLLHIDVHLREIETIPRNIQSGVIYIFQTQRFRKLRIQPGKHSTHAGQLAGEAIKLAAKFCLSGIIHGIVTAPISKHALQEAGFNFSGQTEMLAKITGNYPVAMMLIADSFRVGLLTIHIPLRDVPKHLSRQLLNEKISIIIESLKKDFAIRSPKIALLGLNPHAGESGLIGTEEKLIIVPVIKHLQKKNILINGPFPADGFFGSQKIFQYDAIIAMYHDQGLIPLKMYGFEQGVNFSAGLPIVRTSPDHGTAYDIAGKGIANPTSMTEAIKLAVNIINKKKKRTR